MGHTGKDAIKDADTVWIKHIASIQMEHVYMAVIQDIKGTYAMHVC